jgi:magnesium transporter
MIKIRLQEGRSFVEIPHVKDGCWVDARNVKQDELERLEADFGVDKDILADIMDTDELSRVEYEEDYTAIILRLPVYDALFEVSFYTAPLGIIIFKDKVVTVCQTSSEAIADIADNRVKGLAMRNTTSFVLNILGRAAYLFLKDLKELNRSTNIIEKQLQESIRNYELIQLLSIQKSLVFFTTSIKSNELLMEKLKKSPLIRGKEDEEDLLEDVMTENVQALEMADIYSSILTGTMDAFASVISNNMNIIIKRLTIINIVLMLPTLIYSFYGMNVPLPGYNLALTTSILLFGSLFVALVGGVMLSIQWRKKNLTIPKDGKFAAAGRKIRRRPRRNNA